MTTVLEHHRGSICFGCRASHYLQRDRHGRPGGRLRSEIGGAAHRRGGAQRPLRGSCGPNRVLPNVRTRHAYTRAGKGTQDARNPNEEGDLAVSSEGHAEAERDEHKPETHQDKQHKAIVRAMLGGPSKCTAC